MYSIIEKVSSDFSDFEFFSSVFLGRPDSAAGMEGEDPFASGGMNDVYEEAFARSATPLIKKTIFQKSIKPD